MFVDLLRLLVFLIPLVSLVDAGDIGDGVPEVVLGDIEVASGSVVVVRRLV